MVECFCDGDVNRKQDIPVLVLSTTDREKLMKPRWPSGKKNDYVNMHGRVKQKDASSLKKRKAACVVQVCL